MQAKFSQMYRQGSYFNYNSKTVSLPYSKIIKSIDNLKSRLVRYIDEEIPKDVSEFDELVFLNVYELYQKSLRKDNLIDFGDLLMYMVDIFKFNPEVLSLFR